MTYRLTEIPCSFGWRSSWGSVRKVRGTSMRPACTNLPGIAVTGTGWDPLSRSRESPQPGWRGTRPAGQLLPGSFRSCLVVTANPAVPEPVATPARENGGGNPGCLPFQPGGPETDWTLFHAADRRGIVDRSEYLAAGGDNAGRDPVPRNPSRTWPRLWAWASLAVSECSPNVVSISFRVDVCSNGPWWTTWRRASPIPDGRHPEPELPVVGGQLRLGRGGAVPVEIDRPPGWCRR